MRVLWFLFFFVCGFCFKQASAETFKVAAPFLVEINPITNQVNVANYIGMQLYFPLFTVRPDGTLKSNFLDTDLSKSLDRTFVKYHLCLAKNVRFSDGTLITLADFKSSFSLMAKMYPHLVPLKNMEEYGSHCLLVEMMYPTPQLFKRLTGIASTIIKQTELNSSFPTGLGLYKLSAKTNNTITLKYIGDRKVRFDRIQIIKVDEVNKRDLQVFHDTNQISKAAGVLDLDRSNIYDVSIPKMYSMVINLKSQNSRRCAVALLSKVDWIKAYKISATPKKNFLPWNKYVPFERKEINLNKCNLKQVSLIVPEFYDVSSVQKEIDGVGLKEKIRILSVTNNEFGKKIFSGEEYIGLIAFDSSSSVSILEGEYTTYFESFFSEKNRLIIDKNKAIQKLMANATKMNITAREREQLYEQAEVQLIRDGYVLPVGGLNKKYSYPKGILISSWLDHVNGVPDISAIE